VTGWTQSGNFPTTPGAALTSGSGFVFKIDPPAGGSAPSVAAASPAASMTAANAGTATIAPEQQTNPNSGLNPYLLAQLQLDNAPLLATMLQNSDAYQGALSALLGNHPRHGW
jgi:hypothetical protein